MVTRMWTDERAILMRTQALKSLNPAHLKALLGQEVLMTLSDGTTRQGTVYSLDPESFTVVLLTGNGGAKVEVDRRDDVLKTMDPNSEACVVVPGHAVKAVEVVGSNALTLDALSSNNKGWMNSCGDRRESADLLRAMSAGRTNSWGLNSKYAGMAPLLKPSAGKQLENVKQCLRANMVPFQERTAKEGPGDVELLVLGSLVVSYPYTAEDCACTNEIVLARIRELIASCSSTMSGEASD